MEKIKVRVNSLLDSNSAQELLVSAGYRRKYNNFTLHNGWVCFDSDNNILCVCSSQAGKELDDYKEITLQELRDMVVLKRNNPKDATHKCLWDEKPEYYTDSKGSVYFYKKELDASCWVKTINSKDWCDKNLKPIKEEAMKEYLDKDYKLIEINTYPHQEIHESWIEVPEGANVYARCNIFGDYKWLPKIIDGEWSILWKREKESITDKLVVDEVDNVNHPSHYASGGIECIDAMIAAYGVEAVKAYCKCNAFKYQWRFDKKNGNEDILKAQWYQNKYMELSGEI